MDYRSDLASGGGPPLSIQEIAAKAIDFEYNPLIPLRYWLRTADIMVKEVCISFPGDWEEWGLGRGGKEPWGSGLLKG